MTDPAELRRKVLELLAGELEARDIRAVVVECRDCSVVGIFPPSAGLPAGWREVADDETADGRGMLCPACRGNPGDECASILLIPDQPASAGADPKGGQ